MAMGSPLSSVIANIYMEYFEDLALEPAPLVPAVWLRYVDDTFVLREHQEDVTSFLDHINRPRPSIQFTTEQAYQRRYGESVDDTTSGPSSEVIQHSEEHSPKSDHTSKEQTAYMTFHTVVVDHTKDKQIDHRKATIQGEIDKSGIAEHAWSDGEHRPAWDKVTIIDTEPHWKIRK
ncbi:uncharacterized protein LOC106472086 [Limulus polyphemus]|uniref:Uncharacterized protein LOC106472086 n=1 Tax=Limulus polyphemus TaxID=6850 RepID=A0ABM1BT57_LIMPO|nr:uncharacterized protein LOC106472086 [Limulus polyphemus]